MRPSLRSGGQLAAVSAVLGEAFVFDGKAYPLQRSAPLPRALTEKAGLSGTPHSRRNRECRQCGFAVAGLDWAGHRATGRETTDAGALAGLAVMSGPGEPAVAGLQFVGAFIGNPLGFGKHRTPEDASSGGPAGNSEDPA